MPSASEPNAVGPIPSSPNTSPASAEPGSVVVVVVVVVDVGIVVVEVVVDVDVVVGGSEVVLDVGTASSVELVESAAGRDPGGEASVPAESLDDEQATSARTASAAATVGGRGIDPNDGAHGHLRTGIARPTGRPVTRRGGRLRIR